MLACGDFRFHENVSRELRVKNIKQGIKSNHQGGKMRPRYILSHHLKLEIQADNNSNLQSVFKSTAKRGGTKE